MVFFSKKVWSKFLYKFKFFLGASNILKSAFEHNTVEDLVPTLGKNRYVDRYAWGKFFLIYTFLALLWYFFKQGKVWSKFLYKFKFFLGASNFLKSAFEHNTAEDLVSTSGKNRYVDRYTWGNFFLRDTLLVLLWYFFQKRKSVEQISLQI